MTFKEQLGATSLDSRTSMNNHVRRSSLQCILVKKLFIILYSPYVAYTTRGVKKRKERCQLEKSSLTKQKYVFLLPGLFIVQFIHHHPRLWNVWATSRAQISCFFPPPKYVECKKHNQQSLFYTITMQYYDSLALSLTKYVITFK